MIRYFPVIKTSYKASDAVQQSLSRNLLDLKKLKDVKAPLEAHPMSILGYELEPTYTFGRRQRNEISSQLIEHLEQNCRNAKVSYTLRGGHATFHGPGQLVLYPVLDLQKLGVKVRDYVCILEKSIVSVLNGSYKIPAEQRNGNGLNGVWIENSRQKIASVGVHVRRNVTSHGLALNVSVDPYWFHQIVPCNLPDAQMVSVADVVKHTPQLSVSVIGEQLAQEIAKRMGVSLTIETKESAEKLLESANYTDQY